MTSLLARAFNGRRSAIEDEPTRCSLCISKVDGELRNDESEDASQVRSGLATFPRFAFAIANLSQRWRVAEHQVKHLNISVVRPFSKTDSRFDSTDRIKRDEDKVALDCAKFKFAWRLASRARAEPQKRALADGIRLPQLDSELS